jgi:tetratricopeptide (TPR) repeat protein
VDDLDEAIKLAPGLAFAYFERGTAYHAVDDFQHAIADYSEAIKLKSDDAWYFNNRGNSYTDKHEADRAMADYDQAIRLDPNFALAYYNRGTAYRDLSDDDHALADFNRSIQLDATYAPPSAIARGFTATGAMPIMRWPISPPRCGSVPNPLAIITPAAACCSTAAILPTRARILMLRSSSTRTIRWATMPVA